MLTLAALLGACAAVDADTAPPLRLEDYWSGLHDPWPHQPGKEFEPPSPARLVERQLNYLFPPGTPLPTVTRSLQRSEFTCEPPEGSDLPPAIRSFLYCLAAHKEPTAPEEFGVLWILWLSRGQSADRVYSIGVATFVLPLSQFPAAMPGDIPASNQ